MSRTLRNVFAAAVSFLLLVSCPNPLMDAVKAKVARDEGKVITTFGFTMAENPKLYRDITGVVNETAHTIILSVPKWVPLTDLVATFECEGTTVKVNGVTQTSGTTPNDFSAPVTYTVTPTIGNPVVYTVTATTGAQGLRGGSIQGTPLDLDGTVDTVAGQASIFGDPAGCVQVGSYAYVADYAYHVIWRILTTSPYTTTIFAGTPCVSGSDDGVGTSAKFFNPQGLTTDGTNLYVADFSNGKIRKIVIGTGDVSTLVSGLDGPTGIFYYSGGPLLYETDAGSGTVHELDLAGNIVWSLQNQLTGNEWPVDIVRHTDKLYVADQGLNSIWQIDAATHSAVTIFAGDNEIEGNWNNGTGINAYFFYPSAFALSGNDLYVADYGNNEIRKVTLPGASVTTYRRIAPSSGNT